MSTERPRLPVPPEVVGQFLEEVGYDGTITPEVLSKYSPIVRRAGKPGLPRWQLAITLTRRSETLTPPSVKEFDAERQRRREAAVKRRAKAEALVDDDVAVAAAAYVSQVWEDTGAGPTWRELGRHLGWSGSQTNDCVWELRRRGILDYTTEHRSLHVRRPT